MQVRWTLALANFLSVGHFYLVTYILGPYLGTMLPDAYVGLVVAVGAVATLALFPHVPRILGAIGARRFATMVGVVQGALFLLLSINPIAPVALAAIALACALSPFIAYALDLLLEATMQTEAATGKVRTAFLTAGNIPLLAAPIAIALLLDGGAEYNRIFFAGAVSLVPFIVLMSRTRIPEGEAPRYHRIRDVFRCAMGDPDLRSTFLANFVLQVFYHLAPLYISLYLYTVVGIPWDTLGWMFAVMLIPFVLIEYPAGREADRHGDRNLMALGFLTMGSAFALTGFLSIASPLLLVLTILIISRVGAALVEAMTEGHFFRSVTERDPTTVEIFRMMRPIAALTSPLIGSVLLVTGGYITLFLVSGFAIAALGLYAACSIRNVCRREAGTAPVEARPIPLS